MGKTISMSVGRVAIYHDIRKEISANVDPSLTKNNVIFIDKLAEHSYSVESYTNAKFQPYIDLYNIGKKTAGKYTAPILNIWRNKMKKSMQKKKPIKTMELSGASATLPSSVTNMYCKSETETVTE